MFTGHNPIISLISKLDTIVCTAVLGCHARTEFSRSGGGISEPRAPPSQLAPPQIRIRKYDRPGIRASGPPQSREYGLGRVWEANFLVMKIGVGNYRARVITGNSHYLGLVLRGTTNLENLKYLEYLLLVRLYIVLSTL